MGRKAEAGAGAIYALHRGEISRLFAGVTIPNAICFSPDGAIGYFADTAKNDAVPRRARSRRPACREARRARCHGTAASAASTARWSTPTA